jgi:alpha-mannosidase
VNGTLVRLFNAGDQPVPVPACFTALAQVNYLEEIVPTQTMIPPSSSCDFLIAYTERNDPQ